MCYDFRACQRERERERERERKRLDEERGDRLFANTYAGVCVFAYRACDREFALILLVVIGVSVRPHTLGCGCNCPWQAGP